jgi:hypothetical protein
MYFFATSSSGVYSYRIEGVKASLHAYNTLDWSCDRSKIVRVVNNVLALECLGGQRGYAVYLLDASSLKPLWTITPSEPRLRLIDLVVGNGIIYSLWIKSVVFYNDTRSVSVTYNVSVYSLDGRLLGSDTLNITGFSYARQLAWIRSGEALFVSNIKERSRRLYARGICY